MLQLLILVAAFRYLLGLEIIAERPEIMYFDHDMIGSVNMTIRKVNRRTPYATNLSVDILHNCGNNLTISFKLLELLSSGQYYPTPLFIQDYKFCDFLKEPFFGRKMMEQMKVKLTCPIPAGVYSFITTMPNLEDFPYHIPFAWDHQTTNEGQVQVVYYSTDLKKIVLQYKYYVKIIQKPKRKSN